MYRVFIIPRGIHYLLIEVNDVLNHLQKNVMQRPRGPRIALVVDMGSLSLLHPRPRQRQTFRAVRRLPRPRGLLCSSRRRPRRRRRNHQWALKKDRQCHRTCHPGPIGRPPLSRHGALHLRHGLSRRGGGLWIGHGPV